MDAQRRSVSVGLLAASVVIGSLVALTLAMLMATLPIHDPEGGSRYADTNHGCYWIERTAIGRRTFFVSFQVYENLGIARYISLDTLGAIDTTEWDTMMRRPLPTDLAINRGQLKALIDTRAITYYREDFYGIPFPCVSKAVLVRNDKPFLIEVLFSTSPDAGTSGDTLGPGLPTRINVPMLLVNVLAWAVLAYLASLSAITLVSRTRRTWRGLRGRCQACGYPVSGLRESRCPECGNTVKQWSTALFP